MAASPRDGSLCKVMNRPRLIAELGSGGMATVYLAMRRGMGGFAKLVVVKRLRPDALEGDVLAMFQDEARISARLNHPNVVQTHEVGFDGEHYRLEMEYLDGQPLHRILTRAKKAGRSIAHGVAAAVVRDVLNGLDYAHELRDYDGSPLDIVHRDVSPQNIFVTYDGNVKVVDFGIAKAAGQSSMTQLGMVKGKVRYMAPEQALGRAVDRRADVFACGIVLWQLLTGRGYWEDLDQMAVMNRLSLGNLQPSPRTICETVPEELDAICMKALAFSADDRYATAREMAQALDAFAADGGGRELGKIAAELFDDTRRAVRAAIEQAVATPDEPAEDVQPTKLVALPQSVSVSESAVVVPGQARPESSAAPPPPARSNVGWFVGAGVAVVATVLGIRAWSSRAEQAKETPTVAVTTASSATAGPVTIIRRGDGPMEPAPSSSEPVADPTPRVATRIVHAPAPRTTAPATSATAAPAPPSVAVDAGAPASHEPSSGRGRFRPLDTDDPWDAGSKP